MFKDEREMNHETEVVKAITHEMMEFLACTNNTEGHITYAPGLDRYEFWIRGDYKWTRPDEKEDIKDEECSE